MPLPQPDDVIELATELKEARLRLATLEERWESFFNTGIIVAPAPKLGLKPRIIQFLEERPDVSFNMATVARALDANENSVGPYLSELANDGKIEKRERGLYGAFRAKTPDHGGREITDDDIPF
jgi:hypothetical protein